jgi:hypothetical protein
MSPRLETNSRVEADKAARDFTESVASAYRLATNKITLTDLRSDLPGPDRLLKYKKRMKKLWQETRDPGCKTPVNRVPKAIRCMIRKKTLEEWQTKLDITVLTP